MPVYIVAVIEALAYLSAVPVCAAFWVSTEGGLRLGFGVSAFERRYALRRARRTAGAALPKFPAPGAAGRRIARSILTRLRVEAVSLRGSLCLGDAAATALACGALQALFSALAARADRVEIALSPAFDAPEPRAGLVGMIRVRSGQIMLAAARGGIEAMNGRIAQWTDIRLKV